MDKIYPEIYSKYIKNYSKFSTVLYVQMLNSSYGIMKTYFKFYLNLVKSLKSYGFHMNHMTLLLKNIPLKDAKLF